MVNLLFYIRLQGIKVDDDSSCKSGCSGTTRRRQDQESFAAGMIWNTVLVDELLKDITYESTQYK